MADDDPRRRALLRGHDDGAGLAPNVHRAAGEPIHSPIEPLRGQTHDPIVVRWRAPQAQAGRSRQHLVDEQTVTVENDDAVREGGQRPGRWPRQLRDPRSDRKLSPTDLETFRCPGQLGRNPEADDQ